MNPTESSRSDGFVRQASVRLRAEWWVKAAAITCGMAAFFFAYFELLNHPRFPVTIMPITALDRFIAFRPEALTLYVSLWIYVPLGFALLANRRELFANSVAATVLALIGLGIFWAWPTAVPLFGETWSAGSAFAFLKNVDAAGNACPSMHVAFAVFTAIRLARVLREMDARPLVHLANWLWCAGIVYSTLATRQHVALDAVAGGALGALIGWLRFRPGVVA
jgi:hypothetical protein